VTADAGKIDASIQSDHTLRWNTQVYSLDNVTRLIEDLKRA
jgi:hypothetical protein